MKVSKNIIGAISLAAILSPVIVTSACNKEEVKTRKTERTPEVKDPNNGSSCPSSGGEQYNCPACGMG